MPIDASILIISKAFSLMEERPRALEKALTTAAAFEDESPISVQAIAEHLRQASVDDPVRGLIHHALAHWDTANSPIWAAATAAQTLERRALVYQLLEVEHLADLLQEAFPPYLTEYPEFTILERSDDFTEWFDEQAQSATGFFWPRYRDYLRDVERWPAPSIAALSRATAGVLERIADPSSPSAFQARGLVVGFVQSGKTANFTGVIARAIDAGYRLVIVLGGMTNLLRAQTQRRLDKQLIGKEALIGLAGAQDEYRDAPDWDRFISYGAAPSLLGGCDFVRLTNLNSDYLELGDGPGIAALEFERADESVPIYERANLRCMRTRLIVIKKNKTPLAALVKDLERIQDAGIPVDQIPTLIIDDESDQASLNTRKPTKDDEEDRTAINEAITTLVGLLKRAQYVGYTATPAANVFADPNDKLTIFPKHFIKSLEWPPGYMGASNYHDFGEIRKGFQSNERAYVRDVWGDDLSPNNLKKALNCFLLTGAIKLYRAKHGDKINCRHHTMLVHTSAKQKEHEVMAEHINAIFEEGGYLAGTSETELSTLLESDFRPVWEARGQGMTFPANYDNCKPYLEKCIQRLERGPDRVLIVNGLKKYEEMSPDFDRDDVWKILVGGTKLSRGYTVEGLTVSYYRRASTAADTLMQMGRWFGFRQGYTDLMRLFIGRAEGSKSLDLYLAFEAICRDEIDFRQELLKYAKPDDGSKPLTPMQVPPLVSQHMREMPPAAGNKRFNAVIQSENFGGKPVASTLAPRKKLDVKKNQQITLDLMKKTEIKACILGLSNEPFSALIGTVSSGSMLEFLQAYRWSKQGILYRPVNFLKGQLGDPEIDQWLVIWPLLSGERKLGSWAINETESVSVVYRYRNDSDRFLAYTTPQHVRAAKAIALGENLGNATPQTQEYAQPRTGVALFYAVKGKEAGGEFDAEVSIGFYLLAPPNSIDEKIKWGVIMKDQPNSPIVEVEESL
jgi:hypothetical protein